MHYHKLTICTTNDIAVSRVAIPVILTIALIQKAIDAAPRVIRNNVKKNMKNLSTASWKPKNETFILQMYLYLF